MSKTLISTVFVFCFLSSFIVLMDGSNGFMVPKEGSIDNSLREPNGVLKGDGEWERVFGGSTMMEAYYVDVTSDGGYVLTGWIYNKDSSSRDLWAMKTDGYGRKIWYKIFGAEGSGRNDEGFCVHETSDGGYIVVGYKDMSMISSPYPLEDIWVLKTDKNGHCKILNNENIRTLFLFRQMSH